MSLNVAFDNLKYDLCHVWDAMLHWFLAWIRQRDHAEDMQVVLFLEWFDLISEYYILRLFIQNITENIFFQIEMYLILIAVPRKVRIYHYLGLVQQFPIRKYWTVSVKVFAEMSYTVLYISFNVLFWSSWSPWNL